MEKQVFIGIDVSSATLDICIQSSGSSQSMVIKNEVRHIRKLLISYRKENPIIAMENTGRYNWPIYQALDGFDFRTYVIPPLHLKKSLGLTRGKNDRIDAIRIAQFIAKNYQELEPWQCPSLAIQKLKVLMTERTYRVKSKRQLLKMQHDYHLMKNLQLDQCLKAMNKKLIESLDKQIEAIEKQIHELVESDEHLQAQARFIQSVPGVGKILCWTLLAKTNGFKSIQTPRKLACYGGVAPFDYRSGTSIRGKAKVSVFADKMLKSTLHMAAMRAVRLNNDLRAYYLRKVAEGKNKMSVLNAVRNKIIYRIYALLKNQTLYKNNGNYNLVCTNQ